MPLLPIHKVWLHGSRMTRFRPCIDLHAGQVKQIVGGTLGDQIAELKTNYVSDLSARHYAKLYKDHNLIGGHVIMLGPNNEEAAREALEEWPGALQVGGGINEDNAAQWVQWGAEKVINFRSGRGAFGKLTLSSRL